MKDRHHFNLLTKAGFEIRSFNRFPMLLSLPVHFALRKTAGDDFCAMTSSLELWDRKCQIYHQQPCKNRKIDFSTRRAITRSRLKLTQISTFQWGPKRGKCMFCHGQRGMARICQLSFLFLFLRDSTREITQNIFKNDEGKNVCR